jgi:ferric-dicitrate binding protein FerR (iron transport regulator)
MTSESLSALIDALTNGDISTDDHARLQNLLKGSSEARDIFRERMDLEASLRTWAAEDVAATHRFMTAGGAQVRESGDCANNVSNLRRPLVKIAGISVVAAAIALVIAGPWLIPLLPESGNVAVDDVPPATNGDIQDSTELVGMIRQKDNCEWGVPLRLTAGRFETGSYSLVSGIAELSFDSGTNVVLEAPCELVVTSRDSARLLTGNVFVTVTELSNGFSLHTPEAEIIDLGTEYAVALDDVATEVHVFDGSVIWKPDVEGSDIEDRIDSGEARLYSRSNPTTPKRIPFGQRQFVRRIEADVRAHSGEGLLAYDGFENLAGHLRRGRSGFGWTGGWESARRGRGQLAEVINAPDDEVFGLIRTGRRLLQLSHGDDIRRSLAQPLILDTGTTCFVSLLAERVNEGDSGDRSLRVSLEPETTGRGPNRRSAISFGITTEGFAFINSGKDIVKTAARIEDDETYLCILKLADSESGSVLKVRIYRAGESIDETEPSVWTVTTEAQSFPRADVVRLAAGRNSTWRIDEVRIGTEWLSIVGFRDSE